MKNEINEKEIISRIISGDVNAFSLIINKYKDMVFNIIIKIIHDHTEAEDISQEVFIKVYNHLNNYHYKSKFATWIYSIAFNEAISYTRRSKTTFITLPDNYDAEDESINEDIEYSENLLCILKEELKKLNDDDNLILTLFYQMNNSVEEISTITGLSISNVKIKLFRIRKKLLNTLKGKQNERK